MNQTPQEYLEEAKKNGYRDWVHIGNFYSGVKYATNDTLLQKVSNQMLLVADIDRQQLAAELRSENIDYTKAFLYKLLVLVELFYPLMAADCK